MRPAPFRVAARNKSTTPTSRPEYLNKPILCRSKEEFLRWVHEASGLGASVVISPLLFSQMMRWPDRSFLRLFSTLGQLESGIIGYVESVPIIADKLRNEQARYPWPDDLPMVLIQR